MERIRGIVVRTLTILAGFWIADLAAARVQAGIAAGESIERIMDGMTTMLQHPTALGFDRTSLLCGLGGAGAVGLFHLYRWSMSQRNWREGEEYGSARWSTSREMAPYTDSDTRQNLQMTATEGLSLDAQATRRNLNTAVIGGSGSGKTATHVIPNILKGSMNYACTDPKGELYAKTGGKLEKMGYTVKQLDLVDLTSWTKFNPMRYIDPDKPDVAIMRLVTNIMDNTNGSTPKEHQTNDFWTSWRSRSLTWKARSAPSKMKLRRFRAPPRTKHTLPRPWTGSGEFSGSSPGAVTAQRVPWWRHSRPPAWRTACPPTTLRTLRVLPPPSSIRRSSPCYTKA